MKWANILKVKPVLESEITTPKNIKRVPKPRQNCEKKLQEYADKLANMDGFLFHLPKSGGDTRQDEKENKYFEKIVSRYEPVPEKVACKALRMLEQYENQGAIHRSIKVDDVTWTVAVVLDLEWDEMNFAPHDADYTQIEADAGIMLTIYIEKEHKRTTEYPVLLWHMMRLYTDFSDELEAEALAAVDWR